jgi:hypothetical protein
MFPEQEELFSLTLRNPVVLLLFLLLRLPNSPEKELEV